MPAAIRPSADCPARPLPGNPPPKPFHRKKTHPVPPHQRPFALPLRTCRRVSLSLLPPLPLPLPSPLPLSPSPSVTVASATTHALVLALIAIEVVQEGPPLAATPTPIITPVALLAADCPCKASKVGSPAIVEGWGPKSCAWGCAPAGRKQGRVQRSSQLEHPPRRERLKQEA